MMKRNALLTLGASALAGALLTHTSMAADIETLVGQVQDFAGPNVTLVIDTSGSMSSEVFLDSASAPYDASIDYTGPWDIYESFGIPRRLLYTLTPASSIDYLGSTETDTTQWVSLSAFECLSGQQQLLSAGIYTDRFAQFRIEGDVAFWDFPVPADEVGTGGGQELITECAADFGVHGDGSGQGTYPINFSTLPDENGDVFPWTADESDPEVIDWSDTGARYTFFTPNYLNWIYEREQAGEPVVQTRLEIVQGVATELVQSLKAQSLANNDGLRVGLMRFSANGSGGMVLSPTQDVVTNDTQLIDQISMLTPVGSTPLAETMYELHQYYAGGVPLFGNGTTPTTSVSSSLDGSQYASPIAAACQRNYAILLTDGQPNADFQADTAIGALAGTCTGNCLDEMTSYLSTTDLAPGTGFTGNQTLDTFIIGFFTDFELLENATTAQVDTDDDGVPDAPGYFLASNREQLQQAFETIFGTGGITGDVATFTAPAVTVNSLNRLQNRDTLYFTLYEPSPSGQPHWDGNLKAYRIGRTTDGGAIQILDATGQPAVDPNTGLFFNRAVSLWSSEADGADVSAGGVAGRLSAQRKVYSNLTSDEDLTFEDNLISRDNADVIAGVPGLPQGDDLLELIDFTAGIDTEGGARQILGDPLHSQPLVINFSGEEDDLLLVFGTNDGFLHAIDPTPPPGSTDNLEHFAFIPKELLPKQAVLKANLPSPLPIESKVYGMDGPITAWIQGEDRNDELVVESGETLWVYAGMRRGGRSYYALDLTNRDAPKLKFTISHTQSDYSNLGQTWSAASYAKIRFNEVDRDVLIFGGGYDPNQDDSNTADSMGNSVYIADATTGELIWSAGGTGSGASLELAAMTHSIPSDVRIIDTNGDGRIDRFYVGDMAAQVWRFDIDERIAVNRGITGGRLADLGGTGSANERRFYSPPSVSRYVEDGAGFLAIAMGSGYRAHPLNTQTNDNFYVLRDNQVYSPRTDTNGDAVYGDDDPDLLTTATDLIELTVTGVEAGTDAIQTGQFGRGWFLKLDQSNGEKSLSPAVTAEGRVFFTTYSPDNPALTCDPIAATGLGRFYGIDILTGLPALYDDVNTAEPILSAELGPTGIPPQPRLVFVTPDCEGCVNPDDTSDDGLFVVPSTADIIAQVGTQAFDVGLASRPTRTYWVEY